MRPSPRLLALGAAVVATAAAVGAGVAQEQTTPPPQEQGAPPPPSGVLNATGDGLSAAPPDEAAPPPAPAASPPPEERASAAAAPAAPAIPPPPPVPLKRPRFDTAVLQAVDKVTAETLRFEARVGEPVRYKGLVITLRACEEPAADEAGGDSLGYLEVVSQPAAVPGRPTIAARQVFSGWMTASSPGLNPLQSPGYDVWVIACKTPAPPAPGQA